MNFIVDNWLWFVIGGVVLLMTIIGYLAEKSGFGIRETKELQKPKEVETKEDLEVQVPKEQEKTESKEKEITKETLELPDQTKTITKDEPKMEAPKEAVAKEAITKQKDNKAIVDVPDELFAPLEAKDYEGGKIPTTADDEKEVHVEQEPKAPEVKVEKPIAAEKAVVKPKETDNKDVIPDLPELKMPEVKLHEEAEEENDDEDDIWKF